MIRRASYWIQIAERIAHLLAGADATPSRLELARRVAEAQVDLNRVRTARCRLMVAPIPYRPTKEFLKSRLRLAAELLGPNVNVRAEFFGASFDPPPESPNEADRIAIKCAAFAKELARLDRYEARARSRGKFAIRAMDDGSVPPS